MTNTKVKKRTGRPRIKVRPLSKGIPPKEIIMDIVFNMMELQCLGEEVAGSFRVTLDTLNARLIELYGMTYSEIFHLCNGAGKTGLRKNQFILSKRNAAMAIRLGEEWLGQGNKDKTPPNDKEVDQKLIEIDAAGKLLQKIKNLEEELDALKRKTDPQFSSGDVCI